jgi:aryl-alcohol dehydrogenase-like predicted oxidoreductase
MNQSASHDENKLGGSFTFCGSSMTVHRMGYGAMQLAGPGVFGPPRDPDAAVAVLREAIAAGVNHIDTSDFYGPHVTNQIIRRALHENLKAARLNLPPDALAKLTAIGAKSDCRGRSNSKL